MMVFIYIFYVFRRRIKDALNEQTYDQFLQYASQQFPGNPDQQAILVRQLQDQHYHQYIEQLSLNRQSAANQRNLNNANVTIGDDSERKAMFNENEYVLYFA